ncbi:unnamed protein product [Mortierella alpina]
MHFFKKFAKNKTASAASTPTHTPRSSLQNSRAVQHVKMTPEQALDKLYQTMLPNAASEMKIFHRSSNTHKHAPAIPDAKPYSNASSLPSSSSSSSSLSLRLGLQFTKSKTQQEPPFDLEYPQEFKDVRLSPQDLALRKAMKDVIPTTGGFFLQ